MPNTLSLPDPSSLTLVKLDPECEQAIAIATDAKREIAARRTGTAADIVRLLLPTAAVVVYEFPDGDEGSSVVHRIEDAAGNVLAVASDEGRREHPEADIVHEDTADAINTLITIADGWDIEYLATVNRDNLGVADEALLDLDKVLALVARIDTELAVKRTAPQYQN
jgi:hypothetical protein